MAGSPKCAEQTCDSALRASARSVAKYCSARCRQRASRRRRTVPAEMTARPNWVRRTARKVPVTTQWRRVASVTDRSTWTTYREASRARNGVGLGFVLDGSGVVCIDLDHCLTDGVVAPWARAILDRLPATFIEISASGQGLHAFGRGHVPAGRRIRREDGAAIEIYGDRRYIAITGVRFEAAPSVLADLSEVIADLI